MPKPFFRHLGALLLGCILLMAASPNPPPLALSAKDLFKVFAPAVVKITILQQGIPVGFGTGFFVSPQGHIITNSHVVKPALSPSFELEIEMKDGTKTKSFQIGRCNDRQIDLCILKVNLKPLHWFRLNSDDIAVGEEVYVIGHPRGYDFTLSNGLVSGFRKFSASRSLVDPGKTEEKSIAHFQITAPLSPGNSGGPIFDKNGKLIGVSTMIRVDQGSQNLNFGIAASEIVGFYEKSNRYLSSNEYINEQKNYLKAVDDKLDLVYFKPAFEAVAKGLLPTNNWFAPMEMKAFGKTFKTYLPKTFLAEPCKVEQRKTVGEINYICADHFFHLGMIEISFNQAPLNFVKDKITGQTPKSEPLEIVEDLIKAGQWETYKAKLTPEQIKYLYSVPRPFQCKFSKESLYPMLKNATVCTTTVYNEVMPDAASAIHVFQQEGSNLVVRVSGWTQEPQITSLTYGGSTLAKYCMRQE